MASNMSTKQMTKAERLAASAQAVAARRGEGDRADAKTVDRDIVAPPARAARYVQRQARRGANQEGQVVGRAFRMQPYFFVRLAKLPADRTQPKGKRMITAEQFRAMRFYRAS